MSPQQRATIVEALALAHAHHSALADKLGTPWSGRKQWMVNNIKQMQLRMELPDPFNVQFGPWKVYGGFNPGPVDYYVLRHALCNPKIKEHLLRPGTDDRMIFRSESQARGALMALLMSQSDQTTSYKP